jgi:hypothetical protein
LERRLAVPVFLLQTVLMLPARFLRLAVYSVAVEPVAEWLGARRNGLDRLKEPEAR